MTWSRVVRDLDQARAVLAEGGDPVDPAGGPLDLRVAARLDDDWRRLGAVEVVPGELAVPVEQRLADLAATHALGARLAAGLRPGDLLVLSGPLGAGKTALTQGLGAALGVQGQVTSPTFVLARTHRGQVPLVHVDAYRLRDAGPEVSLDDLDLDDALLDSITVVEWGEGLVEGLAESRLTVVLRRPAAQENATDVRFARVIAHGPRWSAVPVPNVTT